MRPRIGPADPLEVEAIHEAGLEVLEQTGVVFPDPAARALLAAAGARVDEGRRLVRIPPRPRGGGPRGGPAGRAARGA